MLENSRREKVLISLRCVLSNIQSGLLIEACTAFPDPQFVLMDGCDSTDAWDESQQAIAVTLYTTDPVKPPAALNMGKTGGGNFSVYEKEFATSFNATGKLGFGFFYVEDTSLLHITQAMQIKYGTDDSNYYQQTFSRGNFQSQVWAEIIFDFDTAEITGTPDRADIQYISITWRTPAAPDAIPLGDIKIDWLALFDENGWLPVGGADVPELSADNPVVGLYSVAFGKIANSFAIFGIEKTLAVPIDGTGGTLEAWIYISDKTKLKNVPPSGYTAGLLIGQAIDTYWAKFLFYEDLLDVINDRTNGWNQIEFVPETEFDFKVGEPDISAITYIAIGGIAITDAQEIPVGDMKTDYWKFNDIDEFYNNNMKHVYRYSIGSYQTHGNPSIMFSALKENFISNIYPIITSTMLVGLDGEIELPDEAILDEELGKLASDIQVALASQQSLYGHANYVEIKSVEFSVKEGTSTGYVTMMVEIEYDMNQLDPTEDGL